MNRIFFLVVVAVVAGWTGTGMAGEKVEIVASPVSLYWDQQQRAFCCELRSVPEGRGFLACDDATSKAVMEELFSLGKKGVNCAVAGEVTGRANEFERLVVTRVRPVEKATP